MVIKKVIGYVLIINAVYVVIACNTIAFDQAILAPGSLVDNNPLLFWSLIVCSLVGMGGMFFWMLVEIVRIESGTIRGGWLFLLLIFNWVGAAVYFIIRYSRKK